MDSSNQVDKSILNDWVEAETRALDVVASWETLCDVYRTLEFSDTIDDETRVEEFKWIIAEMNKHLSRARKKLMTCTDPDAMMEVLNNMFTSTDASIINRKSLTYHKMRQVWVSQMIAKLNSLMDSMREEMEDGESAYWDD